MLVKRQAWGFFNQPEVISENQSEIYGYFWMKKDYVCYL
jgi:hypothetical protein